MVHIFSSLVQMVVNEYSTSRFILDVRATTGLCKHRMSLRTRGNQLFMNTEPTRNQLTDEAMLAIRNVSFDVGFCEEWQTIRGVMNE